MLMLMDLQYVERALTTTCVSIVAISMILRTFGRYCLKLKNDRERINSSGHFLGLDDSEFPIPCTDLSCEDTIG
jgi:hypothetical protein